MRIHSLITVENDHNIADTKYSVSQVAKITVKSMIGCGYTLRNFGANPGWYEWYRWYEWNERDD